MLLSCEGGKKMRVILNTSQSKYEDTGPEAHSFLAFYLDLIVSVTSYFGQNLVYSSIGRNQKYADN